MLPDGRPRLGRPLGSESGGNKALPDCYFRNDREASMFSLSINRHRLLTALATLAILFVPLVPLPTLAEAPSATNLLPSWN